MSRRINYDAVTALLSTSVPSNKKDRSKKKDKSRRSNSGAGDGEDSFFASDGDLSGLERMSDPGSDWSSKHNSTPTNPYTYNTNTDGYESDDYQQEA